MSGAQKNKVTEEMLLKMIEMRQAGDSYQHIGLTFKVDRSTVRYWLSKIFGHSTIKRTVSEVDKVYKKMLEKDNMKKRQCLHIHWMKKCSTCGAILGSEKGDNDNYTSG